MHPGGEGHLGQKAGEKGVGGDIEGHPQAQVSRPLVHLAGQLTIRHIELQHTETVSTQLGARIQRFLLAPLGKQSAHPANWVC